MLRALTLCISAWIFMYVVVSWISFSFESRGVHLRCLQQEVPRLSLRNGCFLREVCLHCLVLSGKAKESVPKGCDSLALPKSTLKDAGKATHRSKMHRRQNNRTNIFLIG
eukprot:gene26135-biopygen14256